MRDILARQAGEGEVGKGGVSRAAPSGGRAPDEVLSNPRTLEP